MSESVRSRSLAADIAELCKLRVNVLVAVTATIGYLLGTPRGGPVDAGILAAAIACTFVLACASSAWNQIIERRFDLRMGRTESRPVASGRITASSAAIGAALAFVIGVAGLWLAVNRTTAIAGVLTVAIYIGCYTPLKRLSPFALHVGAVAGALPPVMGWTASGTAIGAGTWVLFGILFFWQIPHFHSIAWLYRDEYDAAGFRMLAVARPDGLAVGVESAVYSLLLVACSLVPAALGVVSDWYLWMSSALGVAFVALTLRFAWRRDRTSARRLMYGSLVYLPLVLVCWVIAA